MLDIVIEARKASIGPGMDVRRILPFRLRRLVGPFIFMDHAGPVEVSPQFAPAMDVLPHPHIGLSTVSYLFGGQVTHRDSLGVEQVIRPGEVNWMTAGSGIAHSERFEDPAALAGGQLEMIQTWVALPEKDEEAKPAYLHVLLEQGARFGLPREHSERGIYVAKGSIEVSGHTYTAGQMLVFTKGVDPIMLAKEPTTLMLLGGEPLGERFIWWNFVSSRKERIEQAKADWKEGRILLPPTDNLEFIPLPEDKSKPAGSPPPEALS
jgi:redox-sensitive bicupin YhaK (pirin superfamily)